MKVAITGITLLGTLLAILADLLLVQRNLGLAFLFVIVAMALDMIDGPLARRAGVTSKLGAWLDTFADVFIYLLFPAVYWSMRYDLPLPLLALFVLTGCFRLIRFSLVGFGEDKDKLFYAGMPVFYNQFLLILTHAIYLDKLLLGAVLVVASVLMVSTVPFDKIPVRMLAIGLVAYIAIVVSTLNVL
jgi:CDP-diacylglycerol--serine O-phosphatidyltransferase